VASPTLEMWGKPLAFLLPRLYYPINVAILFREYVMFWTLYWRYVLTPNRDIGVKFLFHNSGSAGWFS